MILDQEPYKDGKGALEKAESLLREKGTVAFAADRIAAGLLEAAKDPTRLFTPIAGSEQVEFQKSSARVRLVFGSNRSGKTKTGSMEIMQRLTNTHRYWKPLIYKPLRALVVAMDYPSFTQQGLGKKIWASVPKRRIRDVSWMDRKTEAPGFIRFDNGSELFLASAEKGSMKFEGADWDLVWMDEIIPDDVILAVRRGLIDRDGMMWNTVTPLSRTKFFEECIRGEAEDPNYYRVFHFKAQDTIKAGYIDGRAFAKYISSVPQHLRETRALGSLPPMGGGNVFDLAPGRRVGEQLLCEETRDSFIGKPWALGLDLAKHRDYIALIALDTDGVVRVFRRFHGVKWQSALNHVFEVCLALYTGAPVVVCLDSSGPGDVFFDLFQQLCAAHGEGDAVRPVAIPTGVASLKTNLVDDLSLALENGQIGWPAKEVVLGLDISGNQMLGAEAIPEIKRLEEEMEAFAGFETASGNMSYHAPNKGGRAFASIKASLKAIGEDLHPSESDDCVVALALARRAMRVLEFGSLFDATSKVEWIPIPQMESE